MFAALTPVYIHFARNRDRAQLRTKIDEFLGRLEKDDFELAREIVTGCYPRLAERKARKLRLSDEYTKKLEQVWRWAEDLRNYRKFAVRISDLETAYRRAREGSTGCALDALLELYGMASKCYAYTQERLSGELEFDLSSEGLQGTVHTLVVRRVGELATQLNSEPGVVAYYSFLKEWEPAIDGLIWPDDWRSRVLRHVHMPSAKLLRLKRQPGDRKFVTYLVGHALMLDSVPDAKLALAYLIKWPWLGRFLPRNTPIELAKVVAREEPRHTFY